MTHFLICARGGSKGIKDKNLKSIKNQSLILRAINFAKKFKGSKIYLSSDSEKIIDVGKKNKINAIKRPVNLALDNTSELKVWKHFIKILSLEKKIIPSFIVNLPPTSPLRKIETVSKAIKYFKKNNFDIVVVIIKSRRNPYFNIVEKKGNLLKVSISNTRYVNRQSAPVTFDLTTIAYVVRSKFLLENNVSSIFEGKVGYIETTNTEEAIDIDDYYDLKLAKLLIK